jgi:hypothetical protein
MAQTVDEWLVESIAEAMAAAGCTALLDARESGMGPPVVYGLSERGEILVRVRIDRSVHDPMRVNGLVENIHHGQLTWNATAATQSLADPATMEAIKTAIGEAARFMRT